MVVKKEFNDIESLVSEAIDIDCEFGVSFITKYDNATVILKELLGYTELTPFLIEISDPSFDGYDKEFIISVSNDDKVFCEKFYRNNKYLSPDGGVVFVLPDCSDECISHIYKYKASFFIDVGIDDDIDRSINQCIEPKDWKEIVIRDENGRAIGYSKFISSDNLGCSITCILDS